MEKVATIEQPIVRDETGKIVGRIRVTVPPDTRYSLVLPYVVQGGIDAVFGQIALTWITWRFADGREQRCLMAHSSLLDTLQRCPVFIKEEPCPT